MLVAPSLCPEYQPMRQTRKARISTIRVSPTTSEKRLRGDPGIGSSSSIGWFRLGSSMPSRSCKERTRAAAGAYFGRLK